MAVRVLSARLCSVAIGFVAEVDPAGARPLIDGVKTSVVVTDTRIQDIIPRDSLSFEAAVSEALQAEPITTETRRARAGRLLRGQ